MLSYESISGFFKQDDTATDATTFDFTKSFGLIHQAQGSEQSDEQEWQRFRHSIDQLKRDAAQGQDYKVLFLGRHGQGYHNVAETKFGTKDWDDYYSKLDSYDGITFLDASLTDLGRQQAQTANGVWKTALANGLPAPQSYYCSPLDRCLETCRITFRGLDLPSDRPYKPMIRELVREVIGEHTCDKRRSKHYIETTYPGFIIEEGFSEDDPLWTADHRETNPEQETRLRSFLDSVFESDDATYISITAHSGAIRNMLLVLGHREFALETGGVIPVVVRYTKSTGKA